VRQGELEALNEELLDVWAADVVGLLDLNNLQDLHTVSRVPLEGEAYNIPEPA
jgi:hypothetical protein